MEWKGRRQSRNIEDRRRMSGTRTAGVGGAGAIVIVVIALFLGVALASAVQAANTAGTNDEGLGRLHATRGVQCAGRECRRRLDDGL